jgi:threonine dehydrogenase-like Zn-dependent dehydrogenase
LEESRVFLGHEGTGVVERLGAGVRTFAIGDLVTSLHGGFADYFVSPADETMLLPQGVDPRHALGEPVACCVHASWRFGVTPDCSVAIVGCGFMGLVCMQLAKLQGAGRILAIDPVPARREMALSLGADEAMSPDAIEDFDADIGLYDVVIEAAGVPAAINLSTDLVKQHGRVSLIGYHQSGDGLRTVNMQRWNLKAIDVINGHVRRMDEKFNAMVEGVGLIADGRLKIEPLVRVYALSDISDAFEDLFSKSDAPFKAVLMPRHAEGTG